MAKIDGLRPSAIWGNQQNQPAAPNGPPMDAATYRAKRAELERQMDDREKALHDRGEPSGLARDLARCDFREAFAQLDRAAGPLAERVKAEDQARLEARRAELARHSGLQAPRQKQEFNVFAAMAAETKLY